MGPGLRRAIELGTWQPPVAYGANPYLTPGSGLTLVQGLGHFGAPLVPPLIPSERQRLAYLRRRYAALATLQNLGGDAH